MNFISLFSGIGGFDLGFERAGMTPVLQVENDKQCCWLLNEKWPDVDKIKDVRDVKGKYFRSIDLICGGFPCQDVSVAGGRKGLAGSRSGLWFEFRRIIEEIKPKWVIIENVPGLLSSNGGRDMGAIIGGLAKLGYWWAYRVLNAEYFGVPQRRRRVFIVASLTRGRPQEVLFEREGGAWDTAPSREEGAEVAATIGAYLAKCSSSLDSNGYFVPVAFQQNTRDEVRLMNGDGQIGGSLSAQPGMKQQNYIAFGGNNTQGNVSVATACNAHGSGRYDFESETFICGFDQSRGQYTGDIAAPLRVNGAVKTGVNDGKPDNMCVSGVFGVRRLTPLECERLQGFTDHWTTGQSDTQRYRQLGNAVAVPVAEWLGRRIMEAL